MAIETVGVRTGRQRNHASSGTIVLGANDSLKGSLRTDSAVTIEGEVEGEIVARGDVVVEAAATVRATVEGRNVDIRGQVTGNVTSRERLTLSGSGNLEGDASAARLVVEDGATLNGSITMSGERGPNRSERGLEAFAVEPEPNGDGGHAAENGGEG